MKIKAVIWQEKDVWCGSVPALPGCHTWGNSYEHLLEMLQDAIQVWLEVYENQRNFAVNPLTEMQPYAYLADPNEPAISPDDWEMNL